MTIKSKILVVDDNPNDLLAYSEFLGNKNIEITTANSGENALQKLMSTDFSLIIMDVQMPGMSGFETVQIIKGREKSKDIPVIFITGEFKQNDFRKYGFEIGGFDYIIKPVDSLTLENKVKAFLNFFNQKKEIERANLELKRANQILNEEIVQREKIEIELKNTMEALKVRTKDLRLSLEKEKELSELKIQFVSMVSHEFRTPLASIKAATDVILRYSNKLSKEDIEKRLHKINHEVLSMTTMLEDILIIGGSKSQKLEFNAVMVNVVELVKTIVSDYQETIINQQLINYQFSSTEILLNADPKWMKHIVINLISNAFKYSDESKSVDIGINDLNGFVSLSVSDQGIGISEEDQKTLFETFHRGENVGNIPGTGLGLSIIKIAIDLHRATVEVKSKLNAGSTFKVVFPKKNKN